MRVLVCGARDYRGREHVFRRLESALAKSDGRLLVIQGGAGGADGLAREWCNDRGVAYVTVPAAWKQFGKAAGPLRNQVMLDDWKPDLVLAFPGGRGTADMVRRSETEGVLVQHVPVE